MSRFTEELLVSPLADGRTWVIRRDFGYDVGEEGSGDTIDVPMGFKTDFASAPVFCGASSRAGASTATPL